MLLLVWLSFGAHPGSAASTGPVPPARLPFWASPPSMPPSAYLSYVTDTQAARASDKPEARPASGKISPAAWAATESKTWAEVLIVLEAQADLSKIPSRADKVTRGEAVYTALHTLADATQGPLRAWLGAQGVAYRSLYIVNALVTSADRDTLIALSARPDVAHVTTNPRVAADIEPSIDPTIVQTLPTGIPWGVERIQAPEVWAMGYRGEGSVVAGQDTGYEWEHPALKAQYRGWDGATASHDFNWHDAIHEGGGRCGPDSPVPCDDYGHGTHTMGTIVGDDGAGNQIGVAPGARWIGCRNMDQGVGTPASYAECFEFFLAPYPVDGDPSTGDPGAAPDVVNNSWSCPDYEGCDPYHIAFLEQVVETVRAAGILVVVSASNYGPSCGTIQEPPAIYDAATTVGATYSDDTVTSFSSRGPVSGLVKPDIAAPGSGVVSSYPGESYTTMSGTSMAAPHVAGTAALIWSAHPGLKDALATTERLLFTTAVPRTSSECGDAPDAVPNSVYGWGRVDALHAVQEALSGTLAGTVQDTAGEPLAGASIAAASTEGTWRGTSTAEGLYALTLISGTYTVTTALPGYAPTWHYGVVASAGVTTTLSITLTEGFAIYLPIMALREDSAR